MFSNGVFYYVHYCCFDSNYHDSCSSHNPRQKQRLLTLPYQKLSKQSAPLVSKFNKLVAWKHTHSTSLLRKKGGEQLQEYVKGGKMEIISLISLDGAPVRKEWVDVDSCVRSMAGARQWAIYLRWWTDRSRLLLIIRSSPTLCSVHRSANKPTADQRFVNVNLCWESTKTAGQDVHFDIIILYSFFLKDW